MQINKAGWMNQAILAKMGWRLKEESSPWAHILKAKYGTGRAVCADPSQTKCIASSSW